MSPKTKRRILLSTAVLLVLIALLWWSRSGPTELDRYKAHLIAQGEILDLDQLAPKRTGNEPDGDLPILDSARLLNLAHTNQPLKFGPLVPELNTTNNLLYIGWHNSPSPRPTNDAQRLAQWSLAKAELLTYQPALDKVHALLLNPPAEKGADYRNIFNYPPGDRLLKRPLAFFLTSGVLTHANAGRSEMAATNMQSLLNLSEHEREEWWVTDQAIRSAFVHHTLHTLHYGLAARIWSEPDLARFQAQVHSISLFTNLHQILLYERALGTATYQRLKDFSTNRSSNPLVFVPDLIKNHDRYFWDAFHADEDQIYFLKSAQERLEILREHLKSDLWATLPTRLKSQRENAFPVEPEIGDYSGHWMSSTYLSNVEYLARSFISTETLRRQTLIALALERYRLAQGHHPASLTELTTQYLSAVPKDPMDAQPMRYLLNDDGTYTLWSIGFDGIDDGASTLPMPKKVGSFLLQRDLVWPRLDPIDLPQ